MDKPQNIISKIPRKQSHRRKNVSGKGISQSPQPQQSPQSQPQQSQPQQNNKNRQNLSQKVKKQALVGVSFNVKKNKVDKFYCPNLSTSSTKSNPTGSVEIQDLPEIPLDSLFGTQ